jgi:uncharacterized phiE125 gp8 family phage protein
MGLRLISPPAAAVSLTEAKAFLRVVDADEDGLIAGFVDAATAYVEQYLGRALMDQTWELVLDAFPDTLSSATADLWPLPTSGAAGAIKIPKPPLIAVVSVKYSDPDGVEKTVPDTDYYVDDVTRPYGWVVPQGSSPSWPATLDAINAVTIRFRAGYIDQTVSPPTESIPRDIKSALLMALGAFYENRQETVVGTIANKMPWGVAEILLRHRVDMSMA